MKEFNYNDGIYKDNDVEIQSNDIANVERFSVSLEGMSLYVVCVQTIYGEWYFNCNDQDTCLKIQKVIAEKSNVIKNVLQRLRTEWGAVRFFWKKMIYISSDVYGFDYRDFLKPRYGDRYDDFYMYPSEAKKISISFYVQYHDKNFMDDLYENFILLLPQNLKKGLEKQLKERLIVEKDDRIKRYGKNFENRDSVINEAIKAWEEAYKDDGLCRLFIELVKEIEFWEKIEKENYDTSGFVLSYLNVVKNEKKLVYDKYFAKKIYELENEYGVIPQKKKELLNDLRNITFEDGVNMFRLFQANVRRLRDKAKELPVDILESPYVDYIEFFEMGSIQISNTLNKINKYKSKKRTIPQSDLDKALLYFYDAESVSEAQKEQQKQTYLENRKNGTIGEKEVEYALKWLDKEYIVIDKNSVGKYGEKTVILNNPAYVDEPQEYDHIIIGKQGVFLIETKNYVGKLIIDSQGNWIRIRKDGTEEGERNPLQQIRRHEKLLKSILKSDVPIISIICMAHPKMIIEGSQNCVIPIIKSDLLVEFIENYKTEKELSKEIMFECSQIIKSYMV